MYDISYTNRFKKDLKLCQKRGLDVGLVAKVISILQKEGVLPSIYN